MNNNSKFIVEIIKKDTEDDRVVIKFNNTKTNTTRVHKVSSFFEKYPKEVNKNLKLATKITNYLNYIQDKVNSGELQSIEFMTIEHGTEYLNNLKNEVTHSELESQKRLLTKFYYFLFKNNSLRRVSKESFKFDSKVGKKVLKIPF